MESKDIGSPAPVWPVTPAKHPGPHREAPGPGESRDKSDGEKRHRGEDEEGKVDAFA